MRVSNNEGKACDAVVRILECRLGQPRKAVRDPESRGLGSEVDLVVSLGGHTFAIEHTMLEAFSGQIESGRDFVQLIEPIVSELSGQLPKPGRYHLILPTDTRIGKSRDIQAARKAIIAWICEAATALYLEQPERRSRDAQPRGYSGVRKCVLEGLGYEIRLERHVHWQDSERHDGRLMPARFGPNDIEKMRRDRVADALEKKCKKLHRWQQKGAVSILLLEDQDIALSNHIVIASAVMDQLIHRTDQPDEIYLISTVVEPWTVWTLKIGCLLLPDIPYVEFNSSELIDLKPERRRSRV